MADQPAPNGTQPPEGKVIDLPRARDNGRSAFLAAFQPGGELEGGDAKPGSAPEPAAKPAPTAEPAKPKADPADDFDEDDVSADEFADDEPAKPDAATQRRISQIQRQEAHSREQLARREQELEQRYAADRADAERFRQLKSRARYSPGDVLAELDPEMDFDFASKDTFARTKAAADDPKWRDAARFTSKGREQDDKLAAALKRIETLENEVKASRDNAQNERDLESYFSSAKKAATAESAPLLARQLAKNPGGAEQRLAAIAAEGFQKTGKLPSEKTLIRIYEKRRRAELEELDVDVDALVGTKKNAKEQTLAAAKEHAATTTSSTTAKPAAGSGSATRSAERERFLANGPE